MRWHEAAICCHDRSVSTNLLHSKSISTNLLLTQNKKILQDVMICLLKNCNDQIKSTSNSGSKLWDWASFFKSINHWVILGLGTAAHPGFPPWGGTSPSFKCGTPNSKYFHRNKPQLNCKWVAICESTTSLTQRASLNLKLIIWLLILLQLIIWFYLFHITLLLSTSNTKRNTLTTCCSWLLRVIGYLFH